MGHKEPIAILLMLIILITFANYFGIVPLWDLPFQTNEGDIGFEQESEEIMIDPFVGFDWTPVWVTPLVIIIAIYFLSGIKIIRPTDVGAIETLGKFSGFRKSGITYTLPFFQKLYRVNVTETLVNVQQQEVITGDNLNAIIDAQVYYMVADDTESLQKALYKVRNYETQIVNLAQTTLRNVIGAQPFKEINSNRGKLNTEIFNSIEEQTKNWGIKVIRVELKQITPPENVQITMNQIIIALNEKISAVDFATARETKAKGEKLAVIQQAIARQQEQKLVANGQAEAIKTVAEANKFQIETLAKAEAEKIKMIANAEAERIKVVSESANKNFIENAKDLKVLEVTQASLQNNSKIIITEHGISPSIIINQTGKEISVFPKDSRKEEGKEK